MSNRLEAILKDPEEHDDNAEDLDISIPVILRDYYHPLVRLVRARGSRDVRLGNNVFLLASLREIGVVLGLHERILGATDDPGGRLEDMAFRVTETVAELGGIDPKSLIKDPELLRWHTDGHLGLDGVLVLAGPEWSEDVMSLDPSERS